MNRSTSTTRSRGSARSVAVISTALALLLLSILGGALGGAVLATHVTPSATTGNPTCEGGQCEFKVDSGDLPNAPRGGDGTVVVEYENVCEAGCDVTVTWHFEGGEIESFDFVSNCFIEQVVVKGGNEGANVYDYGDPGVLSDTGLQTPDAQGVSHVSFCLNDVPN